MSLLIKHNLSKCTVNTEMLWKLSHTWHSDTGFLVDDMDCQFLLKSHYYWIVKTKLFRDAIKKRTAETAIGTNYIFLEVSWLTLYDLLSSRFFITRFRKFSKCPPIRICPLFDELKKGFFTPSPLYGPMSPSQHPLGKPSKKKIAEKETLVHMGGRGVEKIPFF